MKLKYKRLLALTLLLMMAFVSCRPSVEPITTTKSPTVVESEVSSQSQPNLSTVPSLPTVTMEAQEKTPTPAVVATTSLTVIPATITPTIESVPQTAVPVTLTPLPTLASEDLEVAIAELLANPMNCEVPCWWGGIPNTTTAMEILQFLSHYQFTFHERYDNEIPSFIEVWVGFDENENRFDFRVMYSFENSILQGILVEQSRSLDWMLARYGQPDEVWLSADSNVRDGNLAVRLNVVYLQEAIAVGYVVNGILQNGTVIGCFSGEEPGRLQLNTPYNSTNHEDFRGIFEEDRRYLLLEEATDLTMDNFIQQFSDLNQPQCIETPAELWD